MQRTSRRALLPLCVLLTGLVASCGGDKNPNNPTPPAQTRIIRIDGILNFGDVQVGQTMEQVFRIFNDGTATLTVGALQTSGGGTYTASWMNGAIAAGTSQSVTMRFTPAAAQNYSGTLTISADNTAGPNQLTINARGVPAP
jgi:hypothetical protein